jgi:hypothetical protein
MNYYLFLAGAFGVGCGVAIAAALLTYRHSLPPAAEATDAQRQDALERFKIWTEFWKYFLVSFALVLITTLLGQILKQRELDLQKSKQASELALQQTKQEGELALEREKQTSKGLMDENTNLGSFLKEAMSDSADQQFRFASYFSHLVRDPEARHRWESYANFIRDTKKETPQLEANAKLVTAQLKDPGLSEDERAELEATQADLQSQLDLNKALLQAPSKKSAPFDVTFFRSGLWIDASGAPQAYHSDSSSGLDYLGNAGYPGNWWDLVTDAKKNPVVQGPNDPAPGFYISHTSLQDDTKPVTDPSRYVNSSKIPYIDLPQKSAEAAGIKLGDLAAVGRLSNQQVCFAIYANPGDPNHRGEGSIALAECLGIPSSPKSGGTGDGIVYKVFPGSGNRKPRTLEEINREGDRLLKAWGGKELLLTAFKQQPEEKMTDRARTQ